MAHLKKQVKIRSTNGRVYPELYMAPTVDEKEASYYAALELVAQIDEALCSLRNNVCRISLIFAWE